MTYADYFYTYQIGIVFAILIAALLLLAATVAAIYFACVEPMRERSSSATMMKRAPPQPSWIEQAPPPPPSIAASQQAQPTNLPPTPSPSQVYNQQQPPSEYMAPIRASPYQQQQQVPLVQPIDYFPPSTGGAPQQQYRMLAPIAIQQQQTSTVQQPAIDQQAYYDQMDPNQHAWQSVLDAPPRTSYQASAVWTKKFTKRIYLLLVRSDRPQLEMNLERRRRFDFRHFSLRLMQSIVHT